MFLQYCSILLMSMGLAAFEIKPQFVCMTNNNNEVDVTYHGNSIYQTVPASSNGTHHMITVCMYNSIEDFGGQMRVRFIYHVLCQINYGDMVRTLNVKTGESSELDVCLDLINDKPGNAGMSEANPTETIVSFTDTNSPRSALISYDDSLNDFMEVTSPGFVVNESITVSTEASKADDIPGPTASLSVVNAYGILATRILTRDKVRLRIQSYIDKAYLPPIIGQCWYSLTKEGEVEGEEMIVVKSDIQFLDYGCSVQNENQLFQTNIDVFFPNGHLEQVSIIFDLMSLFKVDFRYMQITCQAYFCLKDHPCRARCPPSQTTYQVSGFPRRLNLTTKVYVDFADYTTKAVPVTEPNIVWQPLTTLKPAASKSLMDKTQPYLIIGTLVVSATVLLLIGGAVFIVVTRKVKDEKEDSKGIFHTNARMDEHIHTNKDSQRLIENQFIESRHVDGIGGNHGNNKRLLENLNPKYLDNQRLYEQMQHSSRHHANQRELEGLHLDPRLGVAYQNNQRLLEQLNPNSRQDWRLPNSNQMHHYRGNTSPNDQLTRQSVVCSPKIVTNAQQPMLTMASPSYINRTHWRSPEGVINYGFEDDRGNKWSNYSSNRNADRIEPYSPVGGELYQGHRPVRELFRDKKDKKMNRAHRSDTALLNEALREYFDSHGMIN